MKNIKYISAILLFSVCFSCKDFMEPPLDSYLNLDQITLSRDDYRGVMYNAYAGLPTRIDFTFEAATDNAVTNNDNTSSSRAARGEMSYTNNPLDAINQLGIDGSYWMYNFTFINRLNWFIERWVLECPTCPTPIKMEIDPTVNLQLFDIAKGEAHFLRAWYQFDLLRKYGGVGTDGRALGFPISTRYLTINDDLDLPRNTYQECVDLIVADCEIAMQFLPNDYRLATGTIPEGLVSYAGRASGVAAAALKAKALLYAASPAYNVQNDRSLWQRAAQAAAEAIERADFIDLMTYSAYFNTGNINNTAYNNTDMLFRGAIRQNVNTYEAENFPPRAGNGNGRFNPTQNLVDAFPMSDGYPRGESPTYGYSGENMFSNRDPRLDQFIVRTGSEWVTLTGDNAVNTQPGGPDAFGASPTATRSGYYLKKHLNGTVRIPAPAVNTTFAPVFLSRAELYLSFAEAAIQATDDPDNTTYRYSAREVLAKVRNRALGAGNDEFLTTITGKDAFLSLVKNERRIELCFEDHRFWDLRRWATGANDLNVINGPAYGIYSSDPLEIRSFTSAYFPLPYSEMLKTTNLVNNAGW